MSSANIHFADNFPEAFKKVNMSDSEFDFFENAGVSKVNRWR